MKLKHANACLCVLSAVWVSVLLDGVIADPSENFKVGDPRRCYTAQNNDMLRFEVLPGGGWDNLQNKEAGMVMVLNYSLCRTTDDGRYLIPDGVYTIPIKSSKVETFAELFEHWNDYTSTVSRSVNVDAGMTYDDVSVSGKFSYEYETMKSRQFFDKSVTTRIQARYVRYTAKVEPDTAISEAFKSRLQKIAAHLTLNRTEIARYECQLLVRDFGTHMITSVDVGAALVQEDQLTATFFQQLQISKRQILAAASANFFGLFSFGANYSQAVGQDVMDGYLKNRTSSKVQTFGGPIFRPQQFTANNWSQSIADAMVALDRSGDPIYFAVNDITLPDVPVNTVYDVADYVKAAVEYYYQHNTLRGCTNQDSPNFSFQANIDDGTCESPSENITFGGVYQTCSGSGFTDLCEDLLLRNPGTDEYSCASDFTNVLIHNATKTSSVTRYECHTCWLFFHCCDNNQYISQAQYSAYWCAAKAPSLNYKGYVFGGLYSTQLKNPMTGSRSCPASYVPLHILENLAICVKDYDDTDFQGSLPFAGFFSCKSGNPLSALKDTSAPPYPRQCPKGYSEHLAAIVQGCAITYCIKSGETLAAQSLPKLRRPPFMNAPRDGYTKIEDTSMVVTDDGDLWTFSQISSRTVSKYLKDNGLPGSMTPLSGATGTTSNRYTRTDKSLSREGIAAISVSATLVCVIVASAIFMTIRRRRKHLYVDASSRRQNKCMPEKAYILAVPDI